MRLASGEFLILPLRRFKSISLLSQLHTYFFVKKIRFNCMPELSAEIVLRRDEFGLPGDQIHDNNVNLGETFFVEVMIGDIRPRATGILSLFIDIDFDPNILRNIDIPFEPYRINQHILTSKFIFKPSGYLDNTRGTIKNLGATAVPPLLGMPLGVNYLERFSLLHFQALKEANSIFTVKLNLERTTFTNRKFANINSKRAFFQPISVTQQINSKINTFLGFGSPIFLGAVYKEKLLNMRKKH